ncbi:MAG: hypothetical protein QHH17_00655 [Candidatus Bathyarchaeota archaeon]|nr:hypothetical protein [Candidatus Bathyarchaeota archaeon]
MAKIDELIFGKSKKPRSRAGVKEAKKFFGNKCIICGKPESKVGKLHMAHYKAHSKGGSFTFPLCPTCHTRYDSGLLTKKELKKIHLTPEEYRKFMPKKKKAKKEDIFGLPKLSF